MFVRRKDALSWLESLAGERDPQLADYGLDSLSGHVRHERVEFPRPLQRLDITGISAGEAVADAGAAATLHLARELHELSLTCLAAVAQHEEMPELLDLVTETPEPLHSAKEL